MPRVRVIVIFSFLCLVGAALHAQIPDTFTNLQVLPKGIAKDDLVGAMKSFTAALGVRCIHCHVGEEGKPLSEFDFASDAKETKKTARIMMRMRHTINAEFLSQINRKGNDEVNVRCITCHHGQPVPRLLGDVLFTTVMTHGVDSAIAQYRDLRNTNYGRGVYDFGERTLPEVAEKLNEESQHEQAAIALANLNLEYFPNSGMTYAAIGEIYEKNGEKEKAKLNYEKAYGITHDRRIMRRIEKLSGGE